MNVFDKAALLAAFIASTTALSLTARETASGAPGTGVADKALKTPPPVCCSWKSEPLVTNAAWTVKPPTGPEVQAVPTVFAYQGWAVQMPGSHWIGPDMYSSASSRPVGHYIYSYHFCLCSVPAGYWAAPSLSMKVLSDNEFTATLNGTAIPNGSSPWSPTFQVPTLVTSVPPAAFHPGDNLLRIDVYNSAGMTGLDVLGSITGYFWSVPNASCPGQPS
ncbi:MAG TPA: hypothetical protein VGC96_00090 [Candidatus Elarobacter sp.]|jgi:hypothetical protein